MYSGTLLDIKKVIVLLHTLLAYNGLFFRYKVYLSDPRECLCTSCFLKEDCNYRNNCGIELYDGDLQHSLMKKKKWMLIRFSSHFYALTNSYMFS